jgi:hypothetical protein
MKQDLNPSIMTCEQNPLPLVQKFLEKFLGQEPQFDIGAFCPKSGFVDFVAF